MAGRTLRAVVAALGLAAATVVVGQAPAQAAPPVKIATIFYDSPGTDNRTNASLNAEYVVLKNTTTRAQTITGWTVRDAAGHTYRFASTVLAAGATVTLHTGRGVNSGANRYWNQSNYVWNNDADTGYLRNSAGALIHSCGYTSTGGAFTNC